MNFNEIARCRQSCRSYDGTREVEGDKIDAILETAILAPSACNGQPYHITVCRGERAKKIAGCIGGRGINTFASQVPVFLVISEEAYVPTAALGAKLKNNDYRSIDIGILASYITLEATAQGLGSCIIGWLDDKSVREVCGGCGKVRLIIALGYEKEGTVLREKKRKSLDELVAQFPD
jgi:nitroreductase